jgi:cysteine desulfurase / selenocysteine lyase
MMPLPAPALGSRALFPDLAARVYLSHAAISPASTRVTRAALSIIQDYSQRGVGAYLTWEAQRERLRGKLAGLLGAEPEEIALTNSTTRGISDIALSLPWRAGDRVVLYEGEFPTNVTPWQCAARLFDLKLEFLTADDFRDDRGLERLEVVLRSGVRLVAVSAVQFQTGLRIPLDTVGQLCRQYGAELFVDAIQAVGALPLRVDTTAIDYLSTGSHKWLMGLEGVGALYARRACLQRLQPRTAGWRSHQDAEDFLFHGAGHLRYDRPFKTDARVFEPGAQNAVGFAALEAALDTLLELGIEAIAAHIERYQDALEECLREREFRSLRAPTQDRRSGVLSVLPPSGTDPVMLQRGLGAAGISCSVPDGKLRFSPHFPNSLTEVPIVAREVDRLLQR